MKWAAALPLLGQIAAQNLLGKAKEAIGKAPTGNVYERLGVRTLINCRGTWTYFSGSLELPEVRAAQAEAAKYFVSVIELQRSVASASRDYRRRIGHGHLGRGRSDGLRHGRLHCRD